MNDYISRQAAIDAILHNEEVYSNNFGDDPIDKYTIAIIDNDAQTIAQLPPAKVEPVKYGRWIDPAAVDCYRCSVCKEYTTMEIPRLLYHYCPNCGARMEKNNEIDR